MVPKHISHAALSHRAVTEIELAKGPIEVRHLFLDPAACNTLITLQVRSGPFSRCEVPVVQKSPDSFRWDVLLSTGAGQQVGAAGLAETHHLHARWQKARLLGKLRDVHVSAVGWDAEAACDSTTGCGHHLRCSPRRRPCTVHFGALVPAPAKPPL